MPKVLAIHLPQFHPIAENNEWWGEGFTEWTNVVKAQPLFKGHYQPHLPADLGFYDLRLSEARKAQADLAKEYNIDGFAYYHYWFHGKRILNQPIDEILESKQPDFPFCYFWANETWSRRWEGNESKVLMAQNYSEEDDRAHAEFLITSFKDERYIKIGNRPLFVVYRPFELPNAKKTIAIFEDVCRKNGVEKPFFVASDSQNHEDDPREIGFDCSLHFQTRHHLLSEFMVEKSSIKKTIRNLAKGVFSSKLRVYTYKKYKQRAKDQVFKYPGFPCVNVGFDNTARKGQNAIVIHGQNVPEFEDSLVDAKNKAFELPLDQQLVFINAWNEWAEGNHLEPDKKFGRAFLEAVKRVFPK
ncbi:MAG: glycoside hydrolase family 99-like domain-containing protein [Leadbetterella sp.]